VLSFTDRKGLNPCPILPPVPPGENIDKNIDYMMAKGNAFEFYQLVRNGGDWDYKQKGRQYEYGGNFNYGATGRAMGFPRSVLLREAGRANLKADPTRKNKNLGHPPAIPLCPVGGKAPFGDDPNDQKAIEDGMDYFDNYWNSLPWHRKLFYNLLHSPY